MADLKPFTGKLDATPGLTPLSGRMDGESSGAVRRLADTGLSLAKGVIGVPEAAVGIADLATGGRAGKLVESAGVRFKDAKGVLDDLYSPEQKQANEEVQKAQGFFPTIGAMVRNPSTIVNSAVESAPSMLVGGAVSRGVLAAAPKISPILAGAIGEGATAAGQNAEQVRQETPGGLLPDGATLPLVASGALTAGISRVAGGVANKLGIGDAQTMLATGKLGAVGADAAATGAKKGLIRKVAEGFGTEGILQELPQSYQEQVGQNLAQGKPWDEGAAAAGAQGMLAGGLMGGVAGPLEGHSDHSTTAPAQDDNQKPAATPGLGFNPDAGTHTVFPDGSIALNSDLSPEEQQAAFDKRYAPQPVNPVRAAVQQAADAGGALSAAAGVAMDSGAHQATQDAADLAQKQEQAQSEPAQPATENVAPAVAATQAGEANVSHGPEVSAVAPVANGRGRDNAASGVGNVLDGGNQPAGAAAGAAAAGDGAPSAVLPAVDAGAVKDSGETPAQRDWRNQLTAELATGMANGKKLNPLQIKIRQGQLARATGAQEAVNVQDPAPRAQPEPQAQTAPAQTPEAPGIAEPAAAPGVSADAARVEADGVTPSTSSQNQPIVQAVPAQVAIDSVAQSSDDPLKASINAAYVKALGSKPFEGGIAKTAEKLHRALVDHDAAALADILNPSNKISRSAFETIMPQVKLANSIVGVKAFADDLIGQIKVKAGKSAIDSIEKPGDIKAIAAKQLPDMTDAELQQAKAHYPADHKRTPKITKEINRRALVAKLKPATTNQTQPQQTQPEASAGAAGQVKPDSFVKTGTLGMGNIHVKQSDLDGDRVQLPIYTADGKRKGRTIHRENLDPTGEKQAASNAENADNPFFNVITRKDGTAFPSQPAANRELNKQALGASHEVVPASELKPGASGYILRRRPGTPATEASTSTAPAKAEAAPRWDGLSKADKTQILLRAGWATSKDDLNFVGKNLLTRPWSDIGEGTRATIDKFSEATATATPAGEAALYSANAEIKQPKTLDEFYGAVDAGYRAHFDYAGTNGSTVWIEQVAGGSAWTLKTRDDDSATTFTKGGGQMGWNKLDVMKRAQSEAEHRFTRWTPVVKDEAPEAAGRKVGEMVKLTKPNPAGGKRINIAGTVSKILPDGRMEVRTQNDGYMVVSEAELGHASLPEKQGDAPSQLTAARNMLMEMQARQDANGQVADDRLETQINQMKREIATLEGQNDELDAEMRSYEDKAGKAPAKTPMANVVQAAKDSGKLQIVNVGDKPKLENPTQTERDKLASGRFTVDDLLKARGESGTVKPSTNTVFTEDAAAAARARLKAKLGRLNSGIDPETLLDGITLAGYHIEKGARTFAAYAKAMIDDLGDGVKPYLKSFYMAVKFDPRATAFEGMDSAAHVEGVKESDIGKAEAPATPANSAAPAAKTLSESLYLAIQSNNMPTDNPALRKLVESFDGKPADNARLKQAQEELEAAIARTTRDVIARSKGPRGTFDVLLRLYESQPNLNIRTSTSIANQAYSTPAPLAFLASELAGIAHKDTVLEPTAGTGMLLAGTDPKKAVVNELNPERAVLLRAQGFAVTEKDAATQALTKDKVDAVITNPPFGSVKDASGKPVKVKVDGYDIGQIDHLIAARALEAMKDDGKATLILGANKVAGGLSTDDRIFFNWLYGHYNVTGHFEVDGDLYARQGAGWPVRVISIAGRQRSNTFSPVAGTIQRADNWSQVYEQYQHILDSRGQPVSGAGERAGSAGVDQAKSGNVQQPADKQAAIPDRPVAPGGAISAGNVAGASAGAVADRGNSANGPVAAGIDPQRLNGESVEPDRLAPAGNRSADATDKPARVAGADALAAAGNEFQSPYVPRSSRKDEGVLIPANMAQPTQDALSRLEDEVGDIDQFARKELGYASVAELHQALMGLQVDSVATAIHQIKQGKAVVIADQTGIGKGRQAASIIRWAAKQGHTPVFVSVKPSLFTDMYGDLADIGTHDVNPFIMNGDAWVAGEGGAKLFGNKATTHKRTIEAIAASGRLPEGSNALFMTYSQINVQNAQRQALMALAPNAVFILDESHNAAGASATGDFMIGALEAAKGVTYLSATYAKRPDNMLLYFKTDIGDAAADAEGLSVAMASGGLPLQTVVSNNLVKAGQMFRRERSYDGVSIESKFDTPNRALHERMSNEATRALRAIVSADRLFHEIFVKEMAKDLAAQGASVKDNAGNQAAAGVQHTEFSSVVHNFVKQMLLGLKAQTAATEAIDSLKRGEKPIIAVENTMGSFLNEYAAANGIAQGDSLGAFDYRTVLSRALERTRVLTEKKATGEEVKRMIPLAQLDARTRAAYDQAQGVIDGLKLDIPVSPIDWMRAEITRAGYSVAEITGRNLAVDYSDAKNPVLAAIDPTEQKDKVNTTRLFNGGKLDSLILNVAGSTGISLHASEKFEDQRQRHMIVAQAAGDINIFMQMLGRIHRTGQVRLPKYTILSVDLPTEKRPTAVLSVKMKSLNANTSSNTESATSVKSSDILNKYGDQIVTQYLNDNYALARALGLEQEIGGEPQDDMARKATGRLALQPIETQHSFYDEVEGQYTALIDYLNKTNQNDLEPRTFDFDAKETRQELLFDGPNKATPFGEDAIYGEYSIKAQGTPMKPEEIRGAMAEHLNGKTPEQHVMALVDSLKTKFGAYYKTLPEGAQQEAANQALVDGQGFMQSHRIGSTFRVDINSEPFNAVVLNVRNTHKDTGNPFSLSKIQLTVAVNGALRSLSVPATQFKKIEVSRIAPTFRVEQLFKEQPPNQRETAKIVTGNLLAAYGELQGVRGTIITFTRADGTSEQGILLPKLFDYAKNTRGDYRLADGAAALNFLQKSDDKDIGRFGIMSRDGIVRVLPAGQGVRVQVPKSKLKGAKYFLDKDLIAAGGDFVSSGGFMVATVHDQADAVKVLDLLMKKQALYALPSMAEEAKALTGNGEKPAMSRAFTPAAQAQATATVEKQVAALTANWANAPRIVVAFDLQDARIPAEVRAEDLKQRSGGAEGTPQGFYYRGTAYMMSSQLQTPQDTAKVLFHEVLGHAGLRGLFGKSLNPILDQITLFRRAEVIAKARQYGLRGISLSGESIDLKTASDKAVFDSMSPAQRRTAAEEVLAEMAQTHPELGFVKRAVAAIRNWLRANVPGFKSLGVSDADIIQAYILPARGFIERGAMAESRAGTLAFIRDQNQAAPDSDGAPMFSRSSASAMANKAVDTLNSLMSAPGKVSAWHKSFGTMYNLAERAPAFKPVYQAAQNFINDVSFYATEAADLAPKILPKLENWSDIKKSPVSAQDNKAISAPIFQGTLSWARDESGKVVQIEDLETRYKDLTSEQKGQMLLKKRLVSEDELKRWLASPLDIYDGAVRNRFEASFLKAGVVFTDAELKSIFSLSPEQINLYREFRATTDKSLDNMAKADLLRYGGKDVEALRDQVMDAKTPDDAALLLRDYLFSLAGEDAGRNDDLTASANGMMERADKVSKLKEQGYAPLSRFGQYSVDVVVDGKREYFSLFESAHEANKLAAKMRMAYGQGAVTQGTLSNEAFKMFAGVTPETLELFGNALGLDSTGDQARDKVFQDYLKLTKTNRSAMRRLIHRQGIAGYSEDAGRVLASFVYSNARQTAAALHMGDMSQAITEIPKEQGELKDVAMRLGEYVKNPQEEAQAVRGLLFAQYLGGSVASALVNMTQPLAVSFPYLSQFGGGVQSGKQLTQAYVDNAKNNFEPALAKALKHAEDTGIVSPQEVHQLMAQARGAGTLKSGDGTRTGDALAMGGNALSRLGLAWGKVFGVAEQLNRRTTFIAAYRIAVAQNIANPAAFAEKAVNETQFVYGKANKMQFGRGAIGGTLMTFKTYTISYLELMHRMYTQGGAEGKKAALLGMGVMLLLGGAGGLPFEEDVINLVDGALQKLGYNVSTKKAKQEFLENLFGKAGADFIDKGITGIPGVPIDVSGRLGMGNIIPGTGLFTTRADHSRDLAELAGPMGDFVNRLFQGGGQLLGGDVVKAALTVAPKAVSNMAKGMDMANSGMYKDTKGYKVISTTPAEAAMKIIGFQPKSVADVQESNAINQNLKSFYNLTAADIRARWANGIFEKDPEQIAQARAMLEAWNRNNPDQRMSANIPAILKKAREMNKDKDQRIAQTAPKALRARLSREIADRRDAQASN